MRKCICKIKCSINGHGSGFFCKIPFPNEFKLLPVLVTNNHVLGENDIKEGKKITFSINNNDKDNFEIIIDKTIKTYTKKKYDITFIEIKSIDKIKPDSFLDVDDKINSEEPNDEYKDKDIYIIGNIDKFNLGKIKGIREDNYTILHLCPTNPGSSGSPLINLNNFKIIGIHKGSYKKQNFNLGTFIKQPIEEFYKKYENMISIKEVHFNDDNNLEEIKQVESIFTDEIKLKDKNYFPDANFGLNILICGNYNEEDFNDNLIFINDDKNDYSYLKKGEYKNNKEWKFFLFPNNNYNICQKTFETIKTFIENMRNFKNVLIYFSEIKDSSLEKLLKFYNKFSPIFQPFFIIVNNKEDNILSILEKSIDSINKNLIKLVSKITDIMKYLNEINLYYNQLDDEQIYPINLLNRECFDKRIELISKDIFTFNILLCGKPGAGKSALANKILGKEKALYGNSEGHLTINISKYIHDKYPIVIYDTPGLEIKNDIQRVSDFIKNSIIKKNKIHCILYVINSLAGRLFSVFEYSFIIDLLNKGMELYFIFTHSKNDEDYMKLNVLYLKKYFLKNILDLEKYIYFTDLIDEENDGLKIFFKDLYDKYKLNKIKCSFNSKQKLIKELTILSENIKTNFKSLSLSLENNNDKVEKLLFISLIKIISKIYNKSINADDCIILFEKLEKDFNNTNIVGKLFKYIFSDNSKKIEYISNSLIKSYNDELEKNKISYNNYLKSYEMGINKAIQSFNELFN